MGRGGVGRGPRALLAVGLAVLVGCELSEIVVEPANPVVVAEIYLRVTNDVPGGVALLHVTGRAVEARVGNALVRVTSEEGSAARFEPAPLAACIEGPTPPEFDAACYTLPPDEAALVRAGGSYAVEILLAGGERLHGSVTLPGSFELRLPAGGTGRCRLPSGQLLPVMWTVSEGARAYVPEAEVFGLKAALEAGGVEVASDPVTLLGLAISESDTTIVFPSEFGIFNRFSNDQEILLALRQGLPPAARIDGLMVVSAQGRNAVDWNRGGNFNPSGSVRTPSIFGDGTGVVGGIVNRTFEFTTAVEPGVPSCLPPS
jgi:hypothetical protein